MSASHDGEAAALVAEIVADFTDRRGLRQAWESIDASIRAEIEAEWTAIVGRHLDAACFGGEP